MNKQEVIAKIGKENWLEFMKFMYGQTVRKKKKGSYDFYEHDVDNFLRPKSERFFD